MINDIPVSKALVATPTVGYFTRSKCDENFLPHYDILYNYDKFVRNDHVVFLLRFFSKVLLRTSLIEIYS